MRAIDLFAGWGGFTEGAEQAGVDVVWAANHWRTAVEAHAINHPRTEHVCQDVRQADWSAVPAYDLLLASPACQGHSQAAQPSRARSERVRRHHDALRSTALGVVDCVYQTMPAAFIVENVLDFRRWGIEGDGCMYKWWRSGLELLGYSLHELVLTASHFGVPQRRRRLFIVGTRDGVRCPDLRFEPGPEPAFGPACQWDTGEWSEIASNRNASARERLTIGAARHGRCMVQHVSRSTKAKAATGLPLSEPIRTITTKDQWHLVDGDRHRPLTVRETARAMGFGDSYSWPEGVTRGDAIKGLGNAVCPPVARALVERVAGAITGAQAA